MSCSVLPTASSSWSAAGYWSRARQGRSPPTSACAKCISAAAADMPEPLLAISDLRAGYGDSVVLDGVAFEIEENGSLAVLGRNGVGKTTLLLTIMGYTAVRQGTILWRGRDLTRVPSHRRARAGLGWVAQ